MHQGEERVAIEHPGARVTHDLPDLLPHIRLVAVDGTFGAGRLAGTEGTAFETSEGVVAELPAVLTQVATRRVVCTTVERDHRADRPLFSLDPGHWLTSIMA